MLPHEYTALSFFEDSDPDAFDSGDTQRRDPVRLVDRVRPAIDVVPESGMRAWTDEPIDERQLYVCIEGGAPVGPVSAEQVSRGLAAGKVPRDALVARAGDLGWRPVVDVLDSFDPPSSPLPALPPLPAVRPVAPAAPLHLAAAPKKASEPPKPPAPRMTPLPPKPPAPPTSLALPRTPAPRVTLEPPKTPAPRVAAAPAIMESMEIERREGSTPPIAPASEASSNAVETALAEALVAAAHATRWDVVLEIVRELEARRKARTTTTTALSMVHVAALAEPSWSAG